VSEALFLAHASGRYAANTASQDTTMPYDVITFGEAMIRLHPPAFRWLEQARSLELQTGGAEHY
jgi:hypothetical protein